MVEFLQTDSTLNEFFFWVVFIVGFWVLWCANKTISDRHEMYKAVRGNKNVRDLTEDECNDINKYFNNIEKCSIFEHFCRRLTFRNPYLVYPSNILKAIKEGPFKDGRK